MIAFAVMLVTPAKAAGIKVPKDPDKYNSKKYPHWHVYISLQCGRRLPSPTSHWNNAKVIAAISDIAIRKITYGDVCELGFD